MKLRRKFRDGKFQYIYVKYKYYKYLGWFINILFPLLNKEKNYFQVNFFREVNFGDGIYHKLAIIALKKYDKPVNRNNKEYNSKVRRRIYKMKCVYCEIPLNRSNYSTEHIIPLSLGGCNNQINLTNACTLCNQERDIMDFYEFFYSKKINKGKSKFIK